jgi:hypothetical protein
MSLAERLHELALYYRSARGLSRELLAIGICLVIGIVVMPCLIFGAGRLVLGPYGHGNLFALWHDFLHALLAGYRAAWFIVLGPYLLFWLLRAGRHLLRHKPAHT